MASLPPPSSAPDTATRPVPADDFRSLMGAFPTGVAVITTYGADDRPRGLTCSSLSSVTTAPPTLSVWLTTRGETLTALREYGAFAVNLLHERGERAGEVFAHRVADRFAQVGWRRSPDAGLPWLADDAFAVAECRVTKLVEVSDHTLVVGAVTGVTQLPGTPLLYGARRFASWPGGEVPAGPLSVGSPVTSC
ncbi:flavin reductase family protein [Streptomyces sp. bgisy130]|uniref:flavin reductase family protein n=1 Tax=Streptomyces sp. bgisy130 TaxID=3413788 RepID=UPI003F4A4879